VPGELYIKHSLHWDDESPENTCNPRFVLRDSVRDFVPTHLGQDFHFATDLLEAFAAAYRLMPTVPFKPHVPKGLKCRGALRKIARICYDEVQAYRDQICSQLPLRIARELDFAIRQNCFESENDSRTSVPVIVDYSYLKAPLKQQSLFFMRQTKYSMKAAQTKRADWKATHQANGIRAFFRPFKDKIWDFVNDCIKVNQVARVVIAVGRLPARERESHPLMKARSYVLMKAKKDWRGTLVKEFYELCTWMDDFELIPSPYLDLSKMSPTLIPFFEKHNRYACLTIRGVKTQDKSVLV